MMMNILIIMITMTQPGVRGGRKMPALTFFIDNDDDNDDDDGDIDDNDDDDDSTRRTRWEKNACIYVLL